MILDDYLKNSSLIKWFKKYKKYLFIILIYILYQTNFLLAILDGFGIKLNELSKGIRISAFALSDFTYVLVLLIMFKSEIKKGLKDLKENFSDNMIISLKCWILGLVVMMVSSLIINAILKQNVSNNEALVRESIKLAPIYMLYTCSIIAPILEEMVFRRAIRGLIKWDIPFIILSGLSFGYLHVIGSYNSALDFLYIIPYGSMGSAFAYLLTKTKNITLPIMIHMIHNTILVLVRIIGG